MLRCWHACCPPALADQAAMHMQTSRWPHNRPCLFDLYGLQHTKVINAAYFSPLTGAYMAVQGVAPAVDQQLLDSRCMCQSSEVCGQAAAHEPMRQACCTVACPLPSLLPQDARS